MHCTRSRKKSHLMYWYARQLCWIDGGGPSASYPYVGCTTSRKKSDFMYQYARHLC